MHSGRKGATAEGRKWHDERAQTTRRNAANHIVICGILGLWGFWVFGCGTNWPNKANKPNKPYAPLTKTGKAN